LDAKSDNFHEQRPSSSNLFAAGLSWQMWPSQTSTITSNVIRQRAALNSEVASDDFLGPQRKKLVDMIQEDFPRTPSPVHANQQPLVREPSMLPKTNTRFTISGSADALLEAAQGLEDDSSLAFDIKRLGLLSEEEEADQFSFPRVAAPQPSTARWNKSAFPRSPVTGIISSDDDYYESFGMPQSYGMPAMTAPKPSVNAKPFSPAGPNFGRQSAPGFASSSGMSSLLSPSDKMAILEDFRAGKHKKYELSDLRGFIVDFSTDQHGSRFIQQKLESASGAEKDLVFSEIYPMALQLMTDVFGNYVIQKFFEFGLDDQKIALAHVLHNNVLSLSLQMYGCRVVQKALEHLPVHEQTRLVQELEGHVLRCVKDQNGNHVIQKCIECIPLSTNAPFLAASFLNQASQLAMHPYGCRVIQRIFEHGPADQTTALLDELLRQPGQLIQDQYGNYVIQHVLERGKSGDRSRIIKYLQNHVLEYSQHKFASNVVEKCVSYGTQDQRQLLIEEVLTPVFGSDISENGEQTIIPLHLMMRDQFANYVVQKMLEVVDGEQRELLLASIKPQLPQLRKYTYGKHILAKVERMLGLAPTDSGFPEQPTRQYFSSPSTPRPPLRSTHSPSTFREFHPTRSEVQNYEQSRFGSASDSPVVLPGSGRASSTQASNFISMPSSPVVLDDPHGFPPLGSTGDKRR
jgi:hypothetical protein